MSTVTNLPSLSANGAAMKSTSTSASAQQRFTRPYSAKTVFFYKEGDEFFQGVRVPVSKARYRTLESLLDDLNDKVPLYFGVRRVFTPRGKREVQSIDELENLGRYVCASSKWTKGLTASERFQQWKRGGFENEKLFMPRRQRSINRSTNGPPAFGNATTAVAAAESRKERVNRRLVSTMLAPRPVIQESGGTQQVLFALNGMPNRVYRMQFRKRRLPQFEDVLKELSEMLHMPVAKLYTPDGNKVTSVDDILVHSHLQLLACQRHERPAVAGKLPPIALANGVPSKRVSPRLHKRQVAKQERSPRHNVLQLDPLPKLASNAPASSTLNDEKKNTKRIRRRTISKRKRKKMVDSTSTMGQTDSNDADVHAAATMIQASFRGYRARKNLSTRVFLPDSDEAHRAATRIQAGVKGYLTRKKYRSRTVSSAKSRTVSATDTFDVEGRSNAATTLQTSFRGYAARKRLEDKKNGGGGDDEQMAMENTGVADNAAAVSMDEPKVNHVEENEKPKEAQKPGDGPKKKTKKKKTGACTYRISVYVGNRWAADSNADVYVILHGATTDSKKLVLKQSQQELRFQQNQMDTFDVETAYVGLLKKITVGHENDGYGAGIYIDRVVVAELETDSMQYFFPCCKWFDSGQVDGKIERVVTCAGYQKLNDKTRSAAIDGVDLPVATKGRWTIRLRSERAIPDNFKTLLYLTAYGTFGRSEMIPFPEHFSVAPGAEYSFNVEFGDLGDLFKLRFDAEHESGQAWLLEWVEMKDVDSGEEIRMYSNKWFCDKAPQAVKVLHPQIFREVPVLKIGVEPLPMFQYNVTLRMSSNLIGCSTPLFVQVTGEFGDSGSCLLPEFKSDEEENVHVVIESVSLGRLMFVSVTAPLNETGEIYTESFRALQEIYDRRGVPAPVAPGWVVRKATVRESMHAPYQFIFGDSRIVEPDVPGTLKKQLALTDMEGLKTTAKPSKTKLSKGEKATKSNKSKATKVSSGQWRVYVSTGEHADAGTDCTPYLIVYGQGGVTKPIPLLDKKQRFTPGSTRQFDVDAKEVGRIFKIRVRLDTSGPKPMWYLKRIEMKDRSNGDELRFPVDMWLEKTDDNPEVSVELPAVWPDVPPLPSVLYNVTLCTGTNSENDTDFDVYLIIFGEKGDTGKRFLRSPVGTQQGSCLKPGNIDTFELEAVSVREISKVQLGVEPRKKSASWYLERVEILDPESERLYIFKCDKWFSDSKADQKLERVLAPVSMVDDAQ